MPAEAASWKVLVVQVDSRELQLVSGNGTDLREMHSANYNALSAVLAHRYCIRHGYDYLIVHPVVNVSHIMLELRRAGDARYSGLQASLGEAVSEDGRQAVGAFHKGLGQFRAVSWAKLPVMLLLLLQVGQHYDLIWYIDSDIGISDASAGRSVQEKISAWAEGVDCPRPRLSADGKKMACINWGNPNVLESAMLLFPNSPYGDDEPCAGSFMLRPSLAASMVLDWWDLDLPDKNFKLFHEQDALWRMTSNERREALVRAAGANASAIPAGTFTRDAVTLLQEFQFLPSAPQNNPDCKEGKKFLCAKDYCVGGMQWLCHIPTDHAEMRKDWFREMLLKEEGFTLQHYHAALKVIKHSLALRVDMWDAAVLIERHQARLRGNALGGVALPAADLRLLPPGLRHIPDSRKASWAGAGGKGRWAT